MSALTAGIDVDPDAEIDGAVALRPVTTVGDGTILARPPRLDQIEALTAAVEKARGTDPHGYGGTANAKLLAVLRKPIFETVPKDPSRSDDRQGDSRGASRKHWFRAQSGNGRFRPFFRYDSRTRILIYASVNDAETLRTDGAKSDADAVFKRMLDKGHPTDDGATLLAAESAASPKAGVRAATAKRAD